MAAIDNLINVAITQQTQAVALPSFAVPLIIGKSTPGWSDRVHVYSSPAGMLTDGFTTSSPEYLAALSMYAGSITPTQFMVGLRTSDTMANDMAAIVAQNNGWYGCVLASPNDADILALAPVIESMKKIFIASSFITGGAQTGSDSLFSVLAAAKYNRTFPCYTANPNAIFEAGWMGSQLPQTPGSNNWAYKQLPGVTPDVLTANQMAALLGSPIAGTKGKNVNVYTQVGGSPVTLLGTAASGQFIDVVIGIDWLQANLATAIFSMLSQATKVPYTDAGAAMLMSAVSGVLAQGVANGLLDGKDAAYPINVSCAPVSSVSRSQRAARIAPTIYFQARLQGAFNAVAISGLVTV